MKQEAPKRRQILPLGTDGITGVPGPIVTDPFGSYTGLTRDGETPVQDADDL